MRKIIVMISFLCLMSSSDVRPSQRTDHASWSASFDAAEQCKRQIFGSPRDHRFRDALVVVLQILDQCELDRQVVLTIPVSELATVSVATILTVDIQQHLEEVQARLPQVSLPDACSTLEVERSRPRLVDSTIEEMARRLKAIKMSPVFETSFPIHGSHYKIWIYTRVTASHFDFLGFYREPESSLHAWADELIMLAGIGCIRNDSSVETRSQPEAFVEDGAEDSECE